MAGFPFAAAALEPAVEFLTGTRMEPRLLPWASLTAQDLRTLRTWATECLSPEAARRVLLAVRCAVRACGREAGQAAVPHEATLAFLTRIRRPSPPGNGPGKRVLQRLLETCAADASPRGRRDAAIIALIAYAGLRAWDFRALRRSDYDEEVLLLRLPGRGSDRVRRVVWLDEGCAGLLSAWTAASGAGSSFLFPSSTGSAVKAGGLAPASVRRILARRAREAGMQGLTPGELRAVFLNGLRERYRQGQGSQVAVRAEDEDGQPLLLYRSLA